ncbi:MAG: MoaD/ThiS family protein [Chitinophagaceae bacterium]|nr:MAG: MoaD/ThiS family protein [Chitinophagaceae bacterium]
MQVNIILFGQLTEIAGNAVSVDNVADTDSLVRILHKRYPALADTKYVIAVNKQVVNRNIPLNNNSTVALLPPFSGG